MAPSKLLLGALATGLIAVGTAALTGTVHLPAHTSAQVSATKHEPASVHPVAAPASTPSPSPAQPTPAAPAAQQNGGDGEGDGGD
jgi:hypothetical protein